jgi:hypothetical protein
MAEGDRRSNNKRKRSESDQQPTEISHALPRLFDGY